MDRHKSIKDILSGAIFLAIGLAFGVGAAGYEFGSPLRMGPGFFPLVLAGALCLLGIGVLVKGLSASASDNDLGTVSWRAVILLTGALVFFGATVRGLGLAPAVLAAAFLAALASDENPPVKAAVLAVALTVFCVVIFHFGLGVAVPLVGPWLRG